MVQQQLELWGGPTFLGSRMASDAASKRARRRPGTGHHANSVDRILAFGKGVFIVFYIDRDLAKGEP